jgi:hypothetical protein
MTDISSDSDDYITELKENWNIFGLPFELSLNKTDVVVDDMSWNDAVSAGIINDYVFGWNQAGQSYYFADTFIEGQAYWLYAYQDCMLKREA